MSKIPWVEEIVEGTLEDGTPFKARCWYWAKDIDVHMIFPYPGLRTGRHIMYMLPTTYTKDEFWRKRALTLVAELVEEERRKEVDHPDRLLSRVLDKCKSYFPTSYPTCGSFKTELYGANPRIRSFAILTAKNPLADVPAEVDSTATDVERNRLDILKRINAERDDELVAKIGRNGWRFRKVYGFCGCRGEFLMIVNISLKDTKALAAEYSQQMFVFGSRGFENSTDCNARGREMTYRFYALGNNRVADLRKRYTSSGILPDINPSEYAEAGFMCSISLRHAAGRAQANGSGRDRSAEFDDSLREVASDLSDEVDSDVRLIGESKYEDYQNQYFKGCFSPWYERFYMLRALRQAAEFRNG